MQLKDMITKRNYRQSSEKNLEGKQVESGPEREEIEVARSAAWTLARDGVGLGPPVVL